MGRAARLYHNAIIREHGLFTLHLKTKMAPQRYYALRTTLCSMGGRGGAGLLA